MFNFFYMWLHVFLPPVVHKTVQVNTLTTYIVDEVNPIGIRVDTVETLLSLQLSVKEYT